MTRQITIMQKLQAQQANRGSKKGFTLVEIIIAIAIIAILAAIAIPIIVTAIDDANESTLESDATTYELLIKTAMTDRRIEKGSDTTVGAILAANGIPSPTYSKGGFTIFVDGEGTTKVAASNPDVKVYATLDSADTVSDVGLFDNSQTDSPTGTTAGGTTTTP